MTTQDYHATYQQKRSAAYKSARCDYIQEEITDILDRIRDALETINTGGAVGLYEGGLIKADLEVIKDELTRLRKLTVYHRD